MCKHCCICHTHCNAPLTCLVSISNDYLFTAGESSACVLFYLKIIYISFFEQSFIQHVLVCWWTRAKYTSVTKKMTPNTDYFQWLLNHFPITWETKTIKFENIHKYYTILTLKYYFLFKLLWTLLLHNFELGSCSLVTYVTFCTND